MNMGEDVYRKLHDIPDSMGTAVNIVAMVFGLIALAGLVVNAAGVDPPRIVVLGWWLSLVIYIAVGFVQLAWGAA